METSEATVINIPLSPDQLSGIQKLHNRYKSSFDELPAYVLIFMLFMASSYFNSFFPKHTANLIIENSIAKHILGYTILITSISSIKTDESTLSILGISFIAYVWCYLLSRQGPVSFSASILLLIISYLLNRDIKKEQNTAIIIIRRICIAIVFLSIFLDFVKSAT